MSRFASCAFAQIRGTTSYSPTDVKGAMTPKTDELPRLQTRHARAMNFFATVKKRDDLNDCVAALEADDVRAEFDEAFRRFSESLDMLLPDPSALRYMSDLKWLGKIRAAAKARFRDDTFDISDCGEKVRKSSRKLLSPTVSRFS